jgi:6-pyruvoyltetrahydropterin/6-carboxytetrahydropterin synthase
MELVYGCRKTYNHSIGLSVAFRQHKATTHCQYLHGYALKVSLDFETEALDDKNWVIDFGSLKPLKQWLEGKFDHKTLIAKDDPLLSVFETLQNLGGCDLLVVEKMGIEAFAEMIWETVEVWLLTNPDPTRVQLVRVSVSEHDGNMAYVRRK